MNARERAMNPYREVPASETRKPRWIVRAVTASAILAVAWTLLVALLSHVSAPWPQP